MLAGFWMVLTTNATKAKCVTPQTSNEYLLDAFTFCSFYITRECSLIYTAENFMMLLV
jgi:hypothetical protein